MKKRKQSLPKLRAAMILAEMTMEDLADAINREAKKGMYGYIRPMSSQTISGRFCNRTPWKLSEALLICDVLSIPIEKCPEYFFEKPDRKEPSAKRRGRPRKMLLAPPEEKIK